jgi:hypothetical protein
MKCFLLKKNLIEIAHIGSNEDNQHFFWWANIMYFSIVLVFYNT